MNTTDTQIIYFESKASEFVHKLTKQIFFFLSSLQINQDQPASINYCFVENK
jgi:hypothetical protein